MESTLYPTPPARPPAPYLGGKKLLAHQVIERLRAIKHQCYVEPFVGMGGIFLRRQFKVKTEVINDASREVATLFRVLQRHFVPFIDMLKWQITSRAEFERLRLAAPDTLTDLERAARFLYLPRTAFGGKVSGRNFGVSIGTSGRFDVTKLASMLEDVHERLAGVVIECLPFCRLITTYDRQKTLFYLDPPYWGNENDYGAGMFQRSDFEAMAAQLATIKGRFVLSLNDNPGVRETFSAFRIEGIETNYSIGGGAHKPVGEVLITSP